MWTWRELEAAFRDLENSLPWARLDGQRGAAGETWHIAGGTDLHAKSRFETLARIAAGKLPEHYGRREGDGSVDDAPVVYRWYRRLAEERRFWDIELPGEMTMPDGSKGYIYMGSIHHPAKVAALVCLTEAANEPASGSSQPMATFNAYGQNSRININSTDNSVNTVHDVAQLFQQVERAMREAGADDADRCFEALAAMQRDVGTPAYGSSYASFMQLAANHMTVLVPFLPALARLVSP